MREDDLPLVSGWLRQAHVQRWWKDASAPDHVAAKYLPRIRGTEPTEMYVIEADGSPIGFIQRYRMVDHPDWERSLAPAGMTFGAAAGIDYAIGEPTRIGRGIGSEVVRRFTDSVFADYAEVDRIVVTPQLDNRPSCRVLEKAGYELVWSGLLDSDDPADAGTAALYVLRRPD